MSAEKKIERRLAFESLDPFRLFMEKTVEIRPQVHPAAHIFILILCVTKISACWQQKHKSYKVERVYTRSRHSNDPHQIVP
jgi:hypothetical protein